MYKYNIFIYMVYVAIPYWLLLVGYSLLAIPYGPSHGRPIIPGPMGLWLRAHESHGSPMAPQEVAPQGNRQGTTGE